MFGFCGLADFCLGYGCYFGSVYFDFTPTPLKKIAVVKKQEDWSYGCFLDGKFVSSNFKNGFEGQNVLISNRAVVCCILTLVYRIKLRNPTDSLYTTWQSTITKYVPFT